MARKGPPQPRSLVAAASRVPLHKPPPRRGGASGGSAWQKDALTAAELPELKQLIRWRGNQLAKLDLYAAAFPLDAGPDAEPVPVRDEATGIDEATARLAEDVLARFRSRIGGQSEIIRRLESNLSKVGECWVVYLAPRPGAEPDENGQGATPDEPEEWTVCSISEVDFKDGSYRVKRSPGVTDEQARKLVDGTDDLFRVWEPDDEWFDLPDCALRGCIDAAETLALLGAQVTAEARSGTPALIFCVPNELSFGPTAPADPDRDPDGEAADPFQAELEEHLDSAGDSTSRKTLIPLLLRGPGEHMTPDRLRTIDLSRKPDATVDNRIEATLLRLARGMDAPVETVKGLDSTTYANADQISQDIWEQHLQPRATFLVDGITVGYFRSSLIDEGVDAETAERMFVWYDASALISQPDAEANADGAYDRNEISGAAYRKAKGFSDDDAPEPAEVLARVALRRATFPATLLPALLAVMATEAGVVLPTVEELSTSAAPAENGQAAMAASADVFAGMAALMALERQRPPMDRARPPGTATALALGPATARNAPPLPGARLAAIDRELMTRVLVLANDAMDRALEKAGARLRGRAGTPRDTLRHTAPRYCARTLGPALVAAAGLSDADLLAGAFDAMAADFATLVRMAQAEALAVMATVVPITPAEAEVIRARQADDAVAAWDWLHARLLGLAAERLYDPDPAAPPLGEFDPTLSVPPGIIRAALAMAGGPGGLTAAAPVLLFRSGTDEPAGGVATGETMRAALRDNGGSIEGWVWEYGPAFRTRPFPPHLSLDGYTFTTFDDDGLANSEDFPEYSYFTPGDHDGCVCGVAPILLGPDGVGPETDPYGRGPNVPLPGDPGYTTRGPAAAPTPPPAPDFLPAPSTIADQVDLTAEQIAAAGRELPALKAWVRDAAKAVQEEARFALDSADAYRMAPPYARDSVEAKATGVYDWFHGLAADEQSRLRATWMTGERQTANPDLIAERLSSFYGPGTHEEQMARWVDETRRYDAAGALARGKLPQAGRYGGERFDLDAIFGDGTFAVRELFDSDPETAIRSVASTTRGQAEEFAARAFLRPGDGRLSPFEMSQDDYVAELVDLEARAALIKPIRAAEGDFGPEYSRADQLVLRRLNELVPSDILDADTLPADVLHQKIMTLAQEAGRVEE